MAAFLDALLRSVSLVGQAIAGGGVVFVLWVQRPSSMPTWTASILGRSLALIVTGAVAAGVAQVLAVLVQLAALAEDGGWPIRQILDTTYGRASVVRLLGSVVLVGACVTMRRWGASGPTAATLIGAALVLTGTMAWTSHAVSRLEHRAPLLALEGVHQFAAAVWIGGLIHLTAAALRHPEPRPWPPATLVRFSALALGAVTALVTAGIGLSLTYIDSAAGLFGTAYGLMILTKSAILAVLLALGAANFAASRRLRRDLDVPLVRVRRFVEVELGLGLAALLAAASLTSHPPAVDLATERATFAEVAARLTPMWPTLTSPALADLPVADRDAPRSAADRAWSEYNHHWAGLFVLAMGLLAAAHQTGRARWARHWPLIFLELAAFLFVRNDPEAWPLGPIGFWQSMINPVVLQHRLFVGLVVAFGVFEWMVRAERLRSPGYALVFPVLCVVGGGLLLTHVHAADNLKEQFLIEVTHAPLGVLGMLVGWARWLELRLEPSDRRLPGHLWALGLMLVGVLLLLYREA